MENRDNNFFQLLEEIEDFGSIKSQDFTALTLPILENVKDLHENNQVAFITSVNQVKYCDKNLILESESRRSVISQTPLFKKPVNRSAVDVTENIMENNDLEDQTVEYSNMKIHKQDTPITQPGYLLNYKCWDYELGHYSPMTDIFILGQLLASIAFNLDFRNEDELEVFVNNRERLFFLNKKLHPTILNVIYEMTNLYIEDRTVNLEEAIAKLKNYREYNPENYVDLTETEGFRNQNTSERSNWILDKLKNRLFDISKRNKLLYFSEKDRFLNLTTGSVPLLLDYHNISENELIFWNDTIRKKMVSSKKLVLNSFLEFAENPFLETSLNKIRLDARKSKNEFGFNQLRVVVAFIHWYNFKENTEERITSPLILLPTEIVKKKGVKDRYTLLFDDSEAEINPVLSNYLKDLYDIQLPDFIDLEKTSIEELIHSIESQIASCGAGITLNWRKKPRIQLIHTIAKKNFSIKKKKLENRSRGLNLRSFSYSYSKDNFQPLGLQIFKERIRHKNNALEYIINEDLNPAKNYASAEKVRTFHSTDNDGEINPLIWEIDTCNITLGNFNFKKMSLVRDYNDIINSNTQDDVFEMLFSEIPKRLDHFDNSECDLKSNYPIISADPTQSAAIQIARSGVSYIIQGPPGTGKSQTITNLIADYIARDKKVLFVCEKRAALDVVFHRLKNKKLDELCCLIHDSQTDKKAFIQNLKETYENFLNNDMHQDFINQRRSEIIELITLEIEKVTYFHETMQKGDIPPLQLFEVLHANKHQKSLPDELSLITYPTYSEFHSNREWITEWFNQLRINGFEHYISAYPLAQIEHSILNQNNPKTAILNIIDSCIAGLDRFNEMLDEEDIDESGHDTISNWQDELSLAMKVKNLVDKNKLTVLKKGSTEATHFKKLVNHLKIKETEETKFEKINQNWIEKFNKVDAKEALNQWQEYEKSIFRFLKPGYYNLKNQIKKAYNFDAHKVKPQITGILQQLTSEYEAREEQDNIKHQLINEFGFDDCEEGIKWVESIHKKPNPVITKWLTNDQEDYIKVLIELYPSFSAITEGCCSLFGDISSLTFNELENKLAQAKSALNSLSVFIPHILNTEKLSKELKDCLFSQKWDMSDFDFNLAYKSLHDIYEQERQFVDIDEDTLKHSITKVNALLDKYYESNVDAIRAEVRTQFLDKIRITESLANQLTQDEKIEKKEYKAARKILENEFGKTMRYKSIRELTSGAANSLMTLIKPVWLMSPLSVSDTIPIDTSIFDVVIYDEASQITVEEGVPSLFRTNQTIIVGDEMQMPPTNFFSTTTLIDEEEEEIEHKIGISLDADSILNQGARKLASVMLGWHYRSRRESLISFSNAAFYNRDLLTIPDCIPYSTDAPEIEPVTDVNETINLDSVLGRSISFHYIENALYEKRKNKDEAAYIANLVSELLKQKKKKSIGVVAFSMDQQSEIEDALDKLAQADPEFDTLLEEEYQRIDEDQFNGLFVKNLENVQGDERDIIIMSICYGYNSKGRMLMNFGPINRRGGEKRLNVIFSRAKHHMVVVTSIMPTDIKNDYNEGANYFKKFLTYAKTISDGRLHDANIVLDSMSNELTMSEQDTNPVISQLKESLEQHDYEVDPAIGQSHFKCDLAIRQKGSTTYKLGILIDKKEHYQNSDILEQYCQKPQILTSFGWKIHTVYSKDWFEKPERVLENIKQKMSDDDSKNTINIEDLLTSKTEHAIIDDTGAEEDLNQVENSKTQNNATEPTASSTETEFERYEYKKGSSNKFWEVSVDDTTLTIQYGRIGNKPQVNRLSFSSNEIAESEKQKRVNKKVKKGYLEV